MLDQKMEKRRKNDAKNAPEKKLKMTNVLEDQDSNPEENYQESNVLRKLNDEILIVDEAGYIYLGEFENGAVEFCDETAVGELPIVAEDIMYVDEPGTIYRSLLEYPAELGLEVVEKNEENEVQSANILLNMMLDQRMEKRRKNDARNAPEKKLKMTIVLEDQDSNTEENYQESNVLRKLNDEILIVDEAGYIYLDEFENTAVKFCHETAVGEPPIVAEDVMYVDESGTIFGSMVECPAEFGLQIAEKDEENEEQSENILYVDEVGSISLSMNANKKFTESDAVLPLETFNDEQRHENCDSDLETEMKIRRLKEEICSLEERIKYIESSAHVD